MALINCSECNAEVSDNAQSCPKCGNPINQPKSEPEKGGCLKWVIGGIAVLVLIAFTMDGEDSSPKSSAPSHQSYSALDLSALRSGTAIDWQNEASKEKRLQVAGDIINRSLVSDLFNEKSTSIVTTEKGFDTYSSYLLDALDSAFTKAGSEPENLKQYQNQKVLETSVFLMSQLGWLK